MIFLKSYHFILLSIVLNFVCLSNQIVLAQSDPIENSKIDSVSVAQFANNFFENYMDSLNIPGAVFTVVQDSQIVFSQGYGMADLERRIPVHADSTRFSITGVGIPFTATAVMNLVESGRLNLHTNVNTYLDKIIIPDTYEQPITLVHLLSHTSGFEETLIGYLKQEDKETRDDYLQRKMPSRVRPPGQWAHQIHYESGLATHLIELKSDMDYASYLQKYILNPLDMQATDINISSDQQSMYAKPYVWNKDGYRKPQTLIPPGMVSTGSDMGNFMIMQLQQGRYGDVNILDEETTRLMHTRQSFNHSELPGWTLGFKEDYENGYRLIGHQGAVPGLHRSLFRLIPEEGVGFFAAFNTAVFIDDLITEAFMNQFFLNKKL